MVGVGSRPYIWYDFDVAFGFRKFSQMPSIGKVYHASRESFPYQCFLCLAVLVESIIVQRFCKSGRPSTIEFVLWKLGSTCTYFRVIVTQELKLHFSYLRLLQAWPSPNVLDYEGLGVN